MSNIINIKNIPEGYQSIISNGKHSILGDEPISVNGTDMGGVSNRIGTRWFSNAQNGKHQANCPKKIVDAWAT
jgi:hypothetical protein